MEAAFARRHRPVGAGFACDLRGRVRVELRRRRIERRVRCARGLRCLRMRNPVFRQRGAATPAALLLLRRARRVSQKKQNKKTHNDHTPLSAYVSGYRQHPAFDILGAMHLAANNIQQFISQVLLHLPTLCKSPG